MKRKTLPFILNYCNAELTLQCAASVRAQQPGGLPLLVIDNGSTNDAAAQLRAALGEDVVEALPENGSIGRAFNRGFEIAAQRGYEYVLVLTNDVVLSPETVAVLEEGMDADPKLAALGPVQTFAHMPDTVCSAGGDLIPRQWSVRHRYTGVKSTEVPASGIERVDWLDGAAKLVRLSAVAACGGYSEEFGFYWEDTEWCLRVPRFGYYVGVHYGTRVTHAGLATLGSNKPVVQYYSARNRLLCAAHILGRPAAYWLAVRQLGMSLLRLPLPRWRPVAALRLRVVVDYLLKRPYPKM